MAMNIQDKNVKNLQPKQMGNQDRIAVSGSQAAMRIPPAVLSPAWRFVSPGSRTVMDPRSLPTVSVTALTEAAVKRAGRSAASRSGSLAVTSRTASRPFNAFHQHDNHDCLSHGCRETQQNGLAGYRPAYGTAQAFSRGK
jgi:hypothetical protein